MKNCFLLFCRLCFCHDKRNLNVCITLENFTFHRKFLRSAALVMTPVFNAIIKCDECISRIFIKSFYAAVILIVWSVFKWVSLKLHKSVRTSLLCVTWIMNKQEHNKYTDIRQLASCPHGVNFYDCNFSARRGARHERLRMINIIMKLSVTLTIHPLDTEFHFKLCIFVSDPICSLS